MCSTALKSVVYTKKKLNIQLQTAETVNYEWILAANLQACSTSNITRRMKLFLISFDSFQKSHILEWITEPTPSYWPDPSIVLQL